MRCDVENIKLLDLLPQMYCQAKGSGTSWVKSRNVCLVKIKSICQSSWRCIKRSISQESGQSAWRGWDNFFAFVFVFQGGFCFASILFFLLLSLSLSFFITFALILDRLFLSLFSLFPSVTLTPFLSFYFGLFLGIIQAVPFLLSLTPGFFQFSLPIFYYTLIRFYWVYFCLCFFLPLFLSLPPTDLVSVFLSLALFISSSLSN